MQNVKERWTLELTALHDVCTPVYIQDEAEIFIVKCQHYSFWINWNIKQLFTAVLFKNISSQRAVAKEGLAGIFTASRGWSSS